MNIDPSAPLLERFEHLEAIWPGGALPPDVRVGGTSAVRGWLPEREETDLPARVVGRVRRHRRPIVTAVAIIALASWAKFGIAPALGEGIATRQHEAFVEVLNTLDDSLADARSAVSLVTAPDPALLSDTVIPLSAFTAAALSVSEEARKPLPATPPLVPRNAVEALSPNRDLVSAAAAHAEAIARRINAVLSYRLLLENAFRLPTLPAESTEVEVLSGEISFALAETTDIVLRLPQDPMLAANAAEATGLLERLETWRNDYLVAIRAGDANVAGTLAQEARDGIARLRSGLMAPLAEFAAWAQADLDQLRVDILEASS